MLQILFNIFISICTFAVRTFISQAMSPRGFAYRIL